MEYYKNLLTKKKTSKAQIIFGVLFIILSFLWIFVKKYEGKSIVGFDWFYSIIFFLNGIVNIIESFGISIYTLFGKAFLKINENSIRYKSKVFSKELILNWHEVKEINFNKSKISIISTNKSHFDILFSKFDYISIQEIKNIITEIAEKNNLLLKNNTQ